MSRSSNTLTNNRPTLRYSGLTQIRNHYHIPATQTYTYLTTVYHVLKLRIHLQTNIEKEILNFPTSNTKQSTVRHIYHIIPQKFIHGTAEYLNDTWKFDKIGH